MSPVQRAWVHLGLGEAQCAVELHVVPRARAREHGVAEGRGGRGTGGQRDVHGPLERGAGPDVGAPYVVAPPERPFTEETRRDPRRSTSCARCDTFTAKSSMARWST